jgi:hypothetical protein
VDCSVLKFGHNQTGAPIFAVLAFCDQRNMLLWCGSGVDSLPQRLHNLFRTVIYISTVIDEEIRKPSSVQLRDCHSSA